MYTTVYTLQGGMLGYVHHCIYPGRDACWAMYTLVYTQVGRHAGLYTHGKHPGREACWAIHPMYTPR